MAPKKPGKKMNNWFTSNKASKTINSSNISCLKRLLKISGMGQN
jgi:hypothetical protein